MLSCAVSEGVLAPPVPLSDGCTTQKITECQTWQQVLPSLTRVTVVLRDYVERI